jgi:putative spermidine/putrescine transport system substrate-binding protein
MEGSRMMHRVVAVACASLLGVIGAGCGSSSSTSGAKKAAGTGGPVVINSSGGTIDDAFRKIYWDPFTKATGIQVTNTAPPDIAKLKAMVDGHAVQWDITEIDDGDFGVAVHDGLLAKIDPAALPTGQLIKQAVNPYGVWYTPYSTVLVWDTKKWPMSGPHPTSLMDLWNQKEFPGPRCLQKAPTDNLELGALYSGVPKASVYPINQTAAYAALDKLKPHVAVWWSSGAQSVQAVVNHDCVMGTAWNGRPYTLVSQQHAPLGVAWGDAILHTGWLAIPKGAPHEAAALKLLAFMQDPARQAQAGVATGYTGGAKGVEARLPAAVKPFIATSPGHLATSLVVDDAWWSANSTTATNRFTTWVIGG